MPIHSNILTLNCPDRHSQLVKKILALPDTSAVSVWVLYSCIAAGKLFQVVGLAVAKILSWKLILDGRGDVAKTDAADFAPPFEVEHH